MSSLYGNNRKIKEISHGKKGIRYLVYAESFSKEVNPEKSVFVGVVIRGIDFVEDFRCHTSTLYGLDATETLTKIFKMIGRKDVNVVLVNGVIVSLYNVIDLNKLYSEIKKPIIALSYRESSGLEKILSDLPHGEERLKIYQRNGERKKVLLKNGFTLYIRSIGLHHRTAVSILNKITLHGRIPEPVKIAKNLAKGVFESLTELQQGR